MAILQDEQKQSQIAEMLTRAYWMEIETVMNYIASSVNPDGVRAEEIRESLSQDIEEELGHAKILAQRIKELYGRVPGSGQFKSNQQTLQPPSDPTDIVSVIKGVIDAERGAVEYYTQIIKACDGVDYVTQDTLIDILKDEQGHLRLFEGFLKEYEKK